MATDLDQLRKQAKDLLRAHQRGDAAAADRFARHHPQAGTAVKLADAQLVIAREHGFPSWPRLKSYVDRAARPAVQHPFRADLDYYAERAYGLLASALDGTPTARAEFDRWAQPLTRTGARLVIAKQHGFTGWQALSHHLSTMPDEPFATAFRLIEARDPDRLTAHLDRFPELTGYRGTNGNDLLGLAASTCDVRLVRIVLEHGADPARANTHGWTVLHQAGYSNLPWLARLLLDLGAPPAVDGRGDGGTPLVAALFWGHRETADVLAERVVAPANLRVAAGLDRVDLIELLIGPDGSLTPEAGRHRGFYRPHSGFPEWKPADDPVEIRDEAMAWAARNAAVHAMATLAARGASVEHDVYSGTPLIWAAAAGKLDAVRWLLDAGADPNHRGRFGGPNHGQGITPMHIAAQSGHREVVLALLDAGGDPTIRDDLYGGTASGWAGDGEHEGLAALLRTRET